MSRIGQVTGFYGKLPSHGDFLSRRLPRQFIEPWDQWLQGGLAASREQLGKDWLNTFLVSPIWEFALASGLCGEDAWAGVMMPSVDKVGRYFPLTLAAKADQRNLSRLFEPGCDWFQSLSDLALSCLEYEFDLQAFDERLEKLNLADFLASEPDAVNSPLTTGSGRLAFRFVLDSEQDAPRALQEVGNRLRDRFLAGCSYWRSAQTQDVKPVLLLCEGLPPTDAYLGFLNGVWPKHGWNFFSSRLAAPEHSGRAVDAGGSADLRSSRSPLAIGEDELEVSDDCEVSGAGAKEAELLSGCKDMETNTVPLAVAGAAVPDGDRWDSCALSVVGLRRQINEDAILERADAGLWAVADGMGGHSAGDVASRALVEALAEIQPVDDLEHYSEQVASCLHRVNRDLLLLAESRGYGQIIGTTVVVLLISGSEFRYLWAGDSRLYRYRQGMLEQLTVDHSLYNEAISLGLPPLDGSPEQGRGNVITRAVGADTQLRLDCGQGQVEAGDVFVLCSDGIDKELNHAEIAALCHADSAHDIAHGLVREAENKGGRDNISAVVVKGAPNPGKII